METKERPVSKFTSRLSYTFGAFGNDVFYLCSIKLFDHVHYLPPF